MASNLYISRPIVLFVASALCLYGCSSASDTSPSSSADDSTDATSGASSDSLDSVEEIDAPEGGDAIDDTAGSDESPPDASDVSDGDDGLSNTDVTDGIDGGIEVDGVDVADALDEVDAMLPAEPVYVEPPEDPAEIQVTELNAVPATAVSYIAPNSALASVGSELQWLTGSQLLWSASAPSVRDIIDTGFGFALVLADDAIWIADEDGMEISPLTEYFGETLPTTATRAGDAIWFHSEEGLDRWSDGTMQSLTLSGFEFEAPDLAWDGVDLWMQSSGELYRLDITDDSVLAYPEQAHVAFDGIVGDSFSARLWGISGGDIYRRDAGGLWEWFRLPAAATRVKTHPDAEAVWITTSAATWVMSMEQWQVVFDGLVADFAVEPSGYALLAGPAGVARYAVDAPPPPPPEQITWVKDIAAISAASCGLCHGEGQFAHELAHREQWIEEFDDILFVVGTGAMPLEPYDSLSEQEINLLKAWQADGFLE